MFEIDVFKSNIATYDVFVLFKYSRSSFSIDQIEKKRIVHNDLSITSRFVIIHSNNDQSIY
jgi:hypothetical protein